MFRTHETGFTAWAIALMALLSLPVQAGDDLPEIRKRGVLRHLGTPYANFITGQGDGLEVEMMQRFADHLGVKYEYVPSSWSDFIPDLTGQRVQAKGDDIEITGTSTIRGDVIASGFTMLPWRAKAVDYSIPTFPTQVWLMVRADSRVTPIHPTENESKDIKAVRRKMKDLEILCKSGTCLAPSLYGLSEAGAQLVCFEGSPNEMAPAVLSGIAEATILDVPDCLIALHQWPGRLKIVGPVSRRQSMGAGFRKDAPKLRNAYNEFVKQCQQDGTYIQLIKKYYPDVFSHYPEFFKNCKQPRETSKETVRTESNDKRSAE